MAKPKPKTAKRGRGNVPDHVPTEKSRQMVEVMVAGAIDQEGICAVLGIKSKKTLHKHYRREIDVGTPKIHAMVLGAHLKKIQAGDFNAIKWWEQSRMGWTERIVVDDGKPADTPMRVIVEYVGEAAPARVEQSAPRTRLADDVRKNVQLVG
jgi:hypothetical protein